MKYLCLVYYNEQIMKSMTQAEWGSLKLECLACVEDLTARGNCLDGAPLQTTDSTNTWRRTGGIHNGKSKLRSSDDEISMPGVLQRTDHEKHDPGGVGQPEP